MRFSRLAALVTTVFLLRAGAAFSQRTEVFTSAGVQAQNLSLMPLPDGGLALAEQCVATSASGATISTYHVVEPRSDGGRSIVSALQGMAQRSCIRTLHVGDGGAAP